MRINITLLFIVWTVPGSPVDSVFQLPTWLARPLVITLPTLRDLTSFLWRPLPAGPGSPEKVAVSNDDKTDRLWNSCGAVLTRDKTRFSSPPGPLPPPPSSCRAKIQINRNICNLRVTLKQFSLSGGGRRCLEDRFWISTDLSHGEGVRDGDAGAICGQRNKTEIHVPVSKTEKVFLNFKFGSKSISSPSWDIEVIHQKCEDNLVRKYGLLDSVDGCKNRKESRKNAKETFRRMKKYLFSHRRSHRQPRSVLDWVLHSDSSKSQETDSDDEPEQSKSDNHRGGRMRAMGITGTTIDLARVKSVPSEFYTIATSSNMGLSRFSKQHSLTQPAEASVTRSTRNNKRNYKRRKSLFKKSSVRGDSSPLRCPVYLYSDSHGMTCMCKS